ncbi:MAG: ABC transporter ATP-binding protein [Geodermatophilaceae bacterium]|nr:ABC transporter ATP-binding protein [Geodermatophilaceae bacterium]
MTTTTSRPPAEPVTGAVLSGRALVKSYGNSPALRGVSLSAARGDVLAITGPSGSGKSTLLLCLAGILRPDAGEVRFGDRRIDTENEATRSRLRRREFGVLFQFGQVVPELTAQENVALPLLLSGVRRREAMTAARLWLDRFGVADLADQRPPQMSGGQAQRVAVARAMVTEPEVLFADEPTGALDSLAGEQVLEQLTRVAREADTTVLLVTHDAKVAAYADREIVIRDGLLDADANVDHSASSIGQHRIHP